jgi:hypothetical protein
MAMQDEKSEKKSYTSYEEYYKTFYGNEQQEKDSDWDEAPTSFAKWLTRSILLKAAAKKSTESPTN